MVPMFVATVEGPQFWWFWQFSWLSTESPAVLATGAVTTRTVLLLLLLLLVVQHWKVVDYDNWSVVGWRCCWQCSECWRNQHLYYHSGTVVAPLFGIWADYWNNHYAMKLLILKGWVDLMPLNRLYRVMTKKASESWHSIFDFWQSWQVEKDGWKH